MSVTLQLQNDVLGTKELKCVILPSNYFRDGGIREMDFYDTNWNGTNFAYVSQLLFEDDSQVAMSKDYDNNTTSIQVFDSDAVFVQGFSLNFANFDQIYIATTNDLQHFGFVIHYVNSRLGVNTWYLYSSTYGTSHDKLLEILSDNSIVIDQVNTVPTSLSDTKGDFKWSIWNNCHGSDHQPSTDVYMNPDHFNFGLYDGLVTLRQFGPEPTIYSYDETGMNNFITWLKATMKTVGTGETQGHLGTELFEYIGGIPTSDGHLSLNNGSQIKWSFDIGGSHPTWFNIELVDPNGTVVCATPYFPFGQEYTYMGITKYLFPKVYLCKSKSTTDWEDGYVDIIGMNGARVPTSPNATVYWTLQNIDASSVDLEDSDLLDGANQDIKDDDEEIEENQSGENDTTEEGGGDGEYTGRGQSYGDNIEMPTEPTDDVTLSTDFVRAFVVSDTILRQLATKFNDDDLLNQVTRFFKNDPMDVIISLHSIPVSFTGGASTEITFGNYHSQVSANKLTDRYSTVNCGSISLKGKYNSTCDFSPLTKLQLYLPFIDVVQLDVDDCMNKTLTLQYIIDNLDGTCCATLHNGEHIVGQWFGNCIKTMPISTTNHNRLIATSMGLLSTGLLASTGVGAVAGLATTGMNLVASSKPDIKMGGHIGGSAGWLGKRKPYFILERPNQARPKDYDQIHGFPSHMTGLIKDFKGYSQLEEIHLENIACTETEKDMIESIMKGGYFFK